MAKKHKVKTARKVGGRVEQEQFECDANALDQILTLEKRNPNTTGIWVDGKKVYP